ncbi:hypothetical protein [Pseudonocardia abyssalis]|uniref:DUF998 domain-containing protein n=1 Tax=Pseudonocardia abyssalis TaxID=2792008 RepID=A0ABS6ULZ0_9PSEU|nr:hypothetical protein [Pseudonocardia abyssalis]MBW0115714.1 hypothetical protein [Pseudonocardia abyssalis]MBW0133268.1 hypothetical protein [Pseudonocardia abyssalis]
MTRVGTGTLPATSVPLWVSRAGAVCMSAGILGAASGILLAVYPGQVPEEMFSYPLTADGFTVIQVWFFVQHLGLLAGIAALARAQNMAPGRSARWGTGLAAAGMAMLAVTELIAITARDSTYPGDGTGLLDALYGVSTIAVGVGLVLAGIAVRRGGRWTGWRGLVVLVAGIFVFVPMLPALMGPFVLARLAITAWMLLFAALGYALWRADT